ncbi:MAG: DUF4149 domain-containing protein [Nitrospinae bacterium]|nr:DUF4149 domain-containing protein [Nitrospinota bacterium]MZH03896.1 DUF4149 domain-containing protein [Nitrospinota bacterium]
MVNTIFNFIYLLSLVVWIGSIVFFSFFVAPVVFKTLEREKAGELVGIIFPRYYKLGYVCGTLILLSFLVSGAEGIGLKWCAWGIMILASVLAGVGVNPKAKLLKEKIKSASEEDKPGLEAKFKSLHSLSVKLNAVTLFSGLWLLGLTTSNYQI